MSGFVEKYTGQQQRLKDSLTQEIGSGIVLADTPRHGQKVFAKASLRSALMKAQVGFGEATMFQGGRPDELAVNEARLAEVLDIKPRNLIAQLAAHGVQQRNEMEETTFRGR